MASAPRFRIGVDENGLGPRLGPMLVTAVLAEVTEAGDALISKPIRGKAKTRMGDSKGLMAHGNITLGEAWARVLAERGCAGEPADVSSIDELVHRLSIEARDQLLKPCPKHVAGQCWATHSEAFEAEDALLKAVRKDLDVLAKKGVTIRRVQCVVVCTKRLNEAFASGRSRFIVDLHSMERLVLAMREEAGSDVRAVCGKVGGLGHYEAAFGPLSGRLFTILEETRRRSAYQFPGVGEIEFLQDADASDRLVGLASLVGKWVREALMARVARHYRNHDPELPDPSGYHDPITTRFVEATRLTRKTQKIPDTCFERATRNGV